jgi:hypothetical protein
MSLNYTKDGRLGGGNEWNSFFAANKISAPQNLFSHYGKILK